MHLEIRHLRLITAIADLGSVTGAGQRLSLTQPALSHQLRHIEEQIGERIFVRTTRGMVLTTTGERLCASARRVLAAYASFEREIQRPSNAPALHIAIDGEGWIRMAVLTFRRQHPDAGLEIVDVAEGRWREALSAGLIDLALTTVDRCGGAGVHTVPLFREELLVMIWPARERAGTVEEFAARRSDVTLTSLEAYSMEAAVHALRRQPDAALAALVRAGFGVSVVSRLNMPSDRDAAGRFAAVRMTASGLFRTWVAVLAGEGELSAASRGFLSGIQAIGFAEGASPVP